MKKFTNLEILLTSIIFVSLIIIIILFYKMYFNKRENFKIKKVMCNDNGTPNKTHQNILYKIHEEFKK